MIERKIGILAQGDAFLAILARQGGADGDARHDAVSVVIERGGHRGEDGTGGGPHLHRRRSSWQDHGELVAADAIGHGLAGHGLDPEAHRRDQRVARGMAHRVVDDFEVIDVDQHQAEIERRRGGQARNRLVEARPVRERRQRVVIGQPMIAGANLLVLDRDRAEMDAGLDDLALEFIGAARPVIVEGKAADDAPVAGLDGAGPAGPQAERQHEILEAPPERVVRDVGDADGLAAVDRGAAGADARADRDTRDGGRVGRRERRRGQRDEAPLLVERQDGADDARCDRFGTQAQAFHDGAQRLTAGDGHQDLVLQRLQTF